MSVSSIRMFASKLLLGIAYFSCMLQWLWVATIALPPLIKSGVFDTLISVPEQTRPAVESQPTEMNPFLWTLAIVITIAMVVMTIMIVIRIPATITKKSNQAVHKATASIVPVITQHHTLPAKKRRVISRRTRLGVQLSAAAVPFFASLFVPPHEEITRQIIVLLASYLAAISAGLFIGAWLLEDTKQPTSRTRSRGSRG